MTSQSKRALPIYRVYIRGYIRTKRKEWYDPNVPEYSVGTMMIAETRDIKFARKLFGLVPLELLTFRYKAVTVWLQRYRRIIAGRGLPLPGRAIVGASHWMEDIKDGKI